MEGAVDHEGEDESRVGEDLAELGMHLDLAPGDGLRDLGPTVAGVLVHTGVDEDGVVQAVLPDVAVQDVVLDHSAPQDDRAGLTGSHGQAADGTDVWDVVDGQGVVTLFEGQQQGAQVGRGDVRTDHRDVSPVALVQHTLGRQVLSQQGEQGVAAQRLCVAGQEGEQPISDRLVTLQTGHQVGVDSLGIGDQNVNHPVFGQIAHYVSQATLHELALHPEEHSATVGLPDGHVQEMVGFILGHRQVGQSPLDHPVDFLYSDLQVAVLQSQVLALGHQLIQTGDLVEIRPRQWGYRDVRFLLVTCLQDIEPRFLNIHMIRVFL